MVLAVNPCSFIPAHAMWTAIMLNEMLPYFEVHVVASALASGAHPSATCAAHPDFFVPRRFTTTSPSSSSFG